ncbi:helix-turn-helix transcriptional regulator [Vibrio sp. 99-70-13A1]|nr:helix-turn-helix transcriptional regulator [Vibrio sp. 99-70-13A1]
MPQHFAQYPKKLIDAIRFRMALDLIEKTNHSLIYIAGCCGYARLENMKCAFIKLIGQLPNDIRATSLSIPS